MEEFIDPHRLQQEKVNAYFHSQSSYWREVYARDDVEGEIYRTRQVAVLDWIDNLGLTAGSRVLEIGCGAGFLSAVLAQRGFCVDAIDSSQAMVEQARRQAIESGTTQRLTLEVGDVNALDFAEDSFDLVIAIGVIPWLAQPVLAMQEMARMTKPNGYVILTADNRAGLTKFLDPWYNPLLRPLRLLVKGAFKRFGLFKWLSDVPGATFRSCRFIDTALARTGLVKIRGKTLGFGPFSFCYRPILPEPLGTIIHCRLQSLANRGIPGLRSAGTQYLVLVKKSEPQPLEQSTSTAHDQYHPVGRTLTRESRPSFGFVTREATFGALQDRAANMGVTQYRLLQDKVNAYFQGCSSHWKDIYASDGVQGEVFRERQAAVLDWIESLALSPDSHVLEIGCGADFMAIELARRGLRVQAIDSTEAMIELARRHAAESGTTELLSVDLGDAYDLAFEDESFDLVVAIGVIAYLKQPELMIREMARVTKPDGHIILTAANWAELNNFLDPWYNPVLRPLKRLVKDGLERRGLRHWSPNMTFHSRRFIDAALARAGLVKTKGKTVGFGSFSFFRYRVLPEGLGLALHYQLQHLANQGVPGLRSSGMSYLVLAKKLESEPFVSAVKPLFDNTKALQPGNGGVIDERC